MATPRYPSGPKGPPLVGHLTTFRRDPLAFLLRVRHDYGPIVRFRLATQEMLLIDDPDYIHDVLVTHHRRVMKGPSLQRVKYVLGEGLLTSEGEFWLRQRRLAQPAFHRRRIAAYGATMAELAARQRDRWQDGVPLDVAQEMMRLTLAVVGKTLFAADVEDEASDVGRALTQVMRQFRLVTLPFADLLYRLPLPSVRQFQQARARLDATIYRLIAERRARGGQADAEWTDLLQLLMEAQDEETGARMSDLQLRDEALTIFLAGHETTANALTWTWYLLAQHPAVAARLHAEIDAVLSDDPARLLTVADLPRLRYTEMVLAESMRLYPPAWVIGRRALEALEIGGYHVPRGTVVLMSQYVSHRNERFFPEPLRFDPERWTPERRAARPRFAYYPFGGGPRQCIGEGFAWMEGTLLLATLAQRWQLRLVPDHPVDPQPLITLRPRYGMRMIPERRG